MPVLPSNPPALNRNPSKLTLTTPKLTRLVPCQTREVNPPRLDMSRNYHPLARLTCSIPRPGLSMPMIFFDKKSAASSARRIKSSHRGSLNHTMPLECRVSFSRINGGSEIPERPNQAVSANTPPLKSALFSINLRRSATSDASSLVPALAVIP